VLEALMHSPAHTHSRSAGLTLIELVITLAILAILVGLAVPSFAARVDRGRLQRAAETLAGDISEARFEATRRAQPIYVHTGSHGWAVLRTPDCDAGAASACQVHRADLTQHPGIRVQGDLALRMEADGAAVQSGSVTMTSRLGEQLRVDVSPMGRPRVCASSTNNTPWPRLPVCDVAKG
jgi:type IV fimbrial biogenesis protein FimT